VTSTAANHAGHWQPPGELVTDLYAALAQAPRSEPADRFEAWAWHAMLDEVGPALLTRAAAPAHVTASGVVLDPSLTQVLLVLHGRARIWVQPGGHLEPGDTTLAAAAAREVLEETGLVAEVIPVPAKLSRHHAPCRPGEVDWHLDVQFACIAAADPPTVSTESLGVGWYPLSALPDPLADGMAFAEALDLARRYR
jgi:8-oxo-dGTP pyrophosphatase MutT (NUDIX family)